MNKTHIGDRTIPSEKARQQRRVLGIARKLTGRRTPFHERIKNSLAMLGSVRTSLEKQPGGSYRRVSTYRLGNWTHQERTALEKKPKKHTMWQRLKNMFSQ